MSLTADTADAIVAVDRALAAFEQAHVRRDQDIEDRVNPLSFDEMPEWVTLKEAITNLQEVSLGGGMHFSSLEEARAYRKNDGDGDDDNRTLPEGYHWCVGGCGNYLPNEDGFRCISCSF